MPAALAGGWGAAQLAKAANVSETIALAVIREHAVQYNGGLSDKLDKRLVVARKAQAAALTRIPELESLLDRAMDHLKKALPGPDGEGSPVALDEFGEPVPVDPLTLVKGVQGVVKAAKDLLSYSDQATGMDVVKAVSIRQQTNNAGPVTSWDGVGALEAALAAEVTPVQTPSLPASDDWI